jgi:hypothetical protein
VNTTYFTDYGGQRFAFDRAVVYVNEWEETYFRPVYYPEYPSWTLYGNCYIDYPWGASIYVNGLFWGCAPLYIPRIAVGWHTITIYDHWGYCWEHDFHVSRYNTVVFNKTIINTSVTVKSKYKEVHALGYRDPVKNGYPDFESRRAAVGAGLTKSGSVVGHVGAKGDDDGPDFGAVEKKYARGSTKLVKTDRGFETDASSAIFPDKTGTKRGSTSRSRESSGLESRSKNPSSSRSSGSDDSNRLSAPEKSGNSRSGSSNEGSKSTVGSSKRRTNGSVAPQRKSGSSTSTAPVIEKRKSSGKSESGTIKQETSKQKSSSSDTKKEVKSTPPSSGSKETKSSTSSGGKSGSSNDSKTGSSKGKGGGGTAKISRK